jgi:hypothetical protein
MTNSATLRSAARAGLAAVCLAGALAWLGACGSGHHRAAGARPSATARLSDAQVLAIGRQFSQCIRAHGIPNFPDPIVEGGELKMPSSTTDYKELLRNNRAAGEACNHIIAGLPAHAGRSPQPVTQQKMQMLVRFAQCVRQHGVPNWPDPDANGDFPLAAAGITGKTPPVAAALEACQQYNPDRKSR